MKKLNWLSTTEAVQGVCYEDVMGRKHNEKTEKGLRLNIAVM